MHESSIAHSILEIIDEQCAEQGCTSVDAITVRLGRATGVMPESLTCAFLRRAEGADPGEEGDAHKVGLVGFAGSGKTTVFNTMTGLAVPTGFGGELRLGTVKVPDERIDVLSRIFRPKKTTYAEIAFCDVPGEHGAHKKGLSTKALQQIRDQEALCLVLRDFDNPGLDEPADPMRDLEAFLLECAFADLEAIDRRLGRAQKENAPKAEVATFEMMKAALEDGRPLRSIPEVELARGPQRGYASITDRPLLVALNRSESRAAEPMPAEMTQRLAQVDAAGLVLSASVEALAVHAVGHRQRAGPEDPERAGLLRLP